MAAAAFVETICFKSRAAEKPLVDTREILFSRKHLQSGVLPKSSTGHLELGDVMLKPSLCSSFLELISNSAACCRRFFCSCGNRHVPKKVSWRRTGEDPMCLAIEILKSREEEWDNNFGGCVHVINIENKTPIRCIPQSELKRFVLAHQGAAVSIILSVFFTKHHAVSWALMGKTTHYGESALRGGASSTAQFLRSLSKKLAVFPENKGEKIKKDADVHTMMREAFHSTNKSAVELHEQVEDDFALPPTFDSAVHTVGRQTDRFIVGGRAVIANGGSVGLTDCAEPVIGVGQALALGICKQVPFKPKQHIGLLMNGPLRYPGSHYVIRNGEFENVPREGFNDEAAALQWAQGATVIARHIQDGDMVGVTRSPFVAPHNHLFQKVRVIGGFTLRPHDVVLAATDADFDGDAEIIYVPNDLVAAEQWKAQTPGRLLSYPSGLLALCSMLDGRFGLESSLCETVDRDVFFSALSSIVDIKVIDCCNYLRPPFRRRDLLRLCGSTALDVTLQKDIKHTLIISGPSAAVRLVFNAQNVGKALAAGVCPSGFRLQHFQPPPGLDFCQRAITTTLEKKRFNRIGSLLSDRKDQHETIMGFLSTIMTFTSFGYTDEILELLAEINQQLIAENGEALRLLMKKAAELQKNIPSTTYSHEDVRLKIKTVREATNLIVGVLTASVTPEPRTAACIRWPHGQPTFQLQDRMATNVSSLGSRLLAHHATEGMAPKSQIQTAGDIRNHMAMILRDLHRDSYSALWCDGTQLLSWRAMPICLALSPGVLVNGNVECSSVETTSSSCPWDEVVVLPTVDKYEKLNSSSGGKHSKKCDVIEETPLNEINGAQCSRDDIYRMFSGLTLPVVCMAWISGGPVDSDLQIAPPNILCSSCGQLLVIGDDSLKCSGCSLVAPGRVLLYCSGRDSAPECTEPVEAAPHTKGPLLKYVRSGDVRLKRRRVVASEILYTPKLIRAHARGCRRARVENTDSFIRLECNVDDLMMAGYTEEHQFELEDQISTRCKGTACVIAWNSPTCIRSSDMKVVLIHIYGGSNVLISEIMKMHFGFHGVRLFCPSSSSSTFQLHFDGVKDIIVDAAIEAIPSSVAQLTDIFGDVQACLRYFGPEGLERQMVTEQCGGNLQCSGPSRVLAAQRTANGKADSIKTRPDHVFEALSGNSRKRAMNALESAVVNEKADKVPDAWLGRPKQVGVGSVRLFENPENKKALLAQDKNVEPLPDNLLPGNPVHTSPWLTFEEQSKIVGVRALQIFLDEKTACSDESSDDPSTMALKELHERMIPFAVARDYLDDNDGVIKTELVWVNALKLIPIDAKRRRTR